MSNIFTSCSHVQIRARLSQLPGLAVLGLGFQFFLRPKADKTMVKTAAPSADVKLFLNGTKLVRIEICLLAKSALNIGTWKWSHTIISYPETIAFCRAPISIICRFQLSFSGLHRFFALIACKVRLKRNRNMSDSHEHWALGSDAVNSCKMAEESKIV